MNQKGIIIGPKGLALKRVGTQARRDMEKFFEKKVYLKMFVKVNLDWRESKKNWKNSVISTNKTALANPAGADFWKSYFIHHIIIIASLIFFWKVGYDVRFIIFVKIDSYNIIFVKFLNWLLR